MKKSILIQTAAVLALSAGVSATASASCANGSAYCNAPSHSMSSMSTAHAPRMVPFTSNVTRHGQVSIDGLGSNEFLQETDCPVNVNGLEAGQKVLGCYGVMKKTRKVSYQHVPQMVQVVHPIIYVRYAVPTPIYYYPVPVPTPIYHPMPTCGMPMMPPPMMGGCYR